MTTAMHQVLVVEDEPGIRTVVRVMLQSAGYRVIGVDDFSNSSREVLDRLKTISGRTPEFVRADVCDAAAMDALFRHGRPKQVQLCVLIDRGHRELPIEAAFVGRKVQTTQDEMIELLLREVDASEKVLLVAKD